MFPNLKEVLNFQNKKSEYYIMYIMLKWKLQTESKKNKIKKHFLYFNVFINSINAKKL